MTRRQTSGRRLAFAVLALLFSSAMAQSKVDAPQAVSHPYRDFWYRERVEPALVAKAREAPGRGAVLYDPNDAKPLYTPPERRTRRVPIGHTGLAVCSGDLAPVRSQQPDVRDWNDPLWPAEMFRVLVEPAEPARRPVATCDHPSASAVGTCAPGARGSGILVAPGSSTQAGG
jgi:hypothetical protein